VAQCFPPVIERLFYDLHETLFVALQGGATVAREAYYRRGNLGRRDKDAGRNLEQHLHLIKRLQQHAEDTVRPATGWRREAFSNFPLYHADNLSDAVAVFEHPEKYLRRDVVGKVADERERSGYEFVKIDLEKIPFNEPGAKIRKMFAQERYRLAVDLDHKQFHTRERQQVTRE